METISGQFVIILIGIYEHVMQRYKTLSSAYIPLHIHMWSMTIHIALLQSVAFLISVY